MWMSVYGKVRPKPNQYFLGLKKNYLRGYIIYEEKENVKEKSIFSKNNEYITSWLLNLVSTTTILIILYQMFKHSLSFPHWGSDLWKTLVWKKCYIGIWIVFGQTLMQQWK